MFGIEKNPVKPAVGNHLGSNIAAQARPETDLQFSGGKRVLEGVTWHVRHDVLFLSRA
jgi:hypothetical protein